MTRLPLTPGQRRVYDALLKRIAVQGYSPTFRELAGDLGVTVNAITGHVRAMQRKGWITKADNLSRSIRPVETK